MKKIVFVLMLLSICCSVNAQGIIGKWKTNEEYKSGFLCWSEIDYRVNNTFIIKMFMRLQDQRYLNSGVLVDLILEMNGNYEYSGKAFSHTFDTNSSKVDVAVSFTPDCTLPAENRAKIKQAFKENLGDDREIKAMAKLYTSGGMYKQILLLNDERMILGRADSKTEEFTRVLSEDRIAATKAKRENARKERKEVRLKAIKETDEVNARAFLETFKSEHPEARTTDSGIVYFIHNPGTPGTNALSDEDVVTVNYKGFYLNGVVFDQNTFESSLNRVIKGWSEGVKKVGEGGRITIVIPYDLAYGEIGSSIIPPYSTIVFDIDVIKVQHSEDSNRLKNNVVSRTSDEEQLTASWEVAKKVEDRIGEESFITETSEAEKTVLQKAAEEEHIATEKAEEEKQLAQEAEAELLAARKEEEHAIAKQEESKLFTKRQEANEQAGIVQVETVDSQTGYPIGIYRKGRNLFKSDTNAPITINDLYDSSSWSLYRNGSSQMKAGTYFYVAGGVAASLIGVTVAYTNYDTSDSVLMDFKESTLGICTLCAIPICTVTGAVLRLIGKNKLNTVVNKQNGTKVGSVSFGLQQNGMGMALNF